LLPSVWRSTQLPLQREREAGHWVIAPGAEKAVPPDEPAPLFGDGDDELPCSPKNRIRARITITTIMPAMIFGVRTKAGAAEGFGGIRGGGGGGAG
jgi:hypothetical protein